MIESLHSGISYITRHAHSRFQKNLSQYRWNFVKQWITIKWNWCLKNIELFHPRGSTLQKPRTFFQETRRIPENPQGFQQNPENPHDIDSTKSSRILKNPLESLGIPRNPQESPVNPQNPQESWESSEFIPDKSWKPRTTFLKCRTPRSKLRKSMEVL